MSTKDLFSRVAKEAKASDIREILKVIKSGDIISFAGGMPDPSLFPVDEIKQITADVLNQRAGVALQYETTEGYSGLRDALFKFMRSEGMQVSSADEILVTTGSQQALDLFGRAFLDPGDTIILEEPTYLAALSAFIVHSPRILLAPMDSGGLDSGALRKALKERRSGSKIKFLYTVPTCQNPSGLTTTEERRKELVELAYEYDFVIIEDDPYSYLSDGKNPPFIKALDDERVLYTSTFSKILAPGLRLGWIAAPEELTSKFAILKQSLDLCTNTLSQHIACEFMVRGHLQGYIERLKPAYRKKREAMLQALAENMPDGAEWTRPTGGMFIWATLPPDYDTAQMLPQAVSNGVAYVPGGSFHPSGKGKNTLRINYSYPTMEQIWEGARRLGNTIRSYRART
ncbi:MAG: PLP-dependent aminotransferase family protein [Candidatus Methanosuratincola sp.]|jgi:2-aminoadipate transaminase|nr:PLP-dependent aminotransferase family protein [Candidatus Methanosuratincola sp.]